MEDKNLRSILVVFNIETLELNVDAPELGLDVVISFLQRALRQCENAEKIVIAQQVSAAVRDLNANLDMNNQRTKRVLSTIKM